MVKREAGFTLVELMITMVIFILIIAAASGVFTGLMTQFKQQSKITESNIEGTLGLEIVRQDLEHAGYGLPWDLNGASYTEATVESLTSWVDRDFNDGPPDNPARGSDPAGASNPPAGIRSGNGYALNGSDVLVIKAINVANSDTCQKWAKLSDASPYVNTWTPAGENLISNDRVIVLFPGSPNSSDRMLITNGSAFSTTFGIITSLPWRPTSAHEVRIIYGVDSNTDLRMPFNRADYYIRKPTSGMPSRCAPNTGILYKSIVNQSNGMHTELPLLDCVADMQVAFRLDTDGDGTIDTTTDDVATFTAQQIRDQVKEVRVYILSQEGQKDLNYTYPNATIAIPAHPDPAEGLGSTFDLATTVGDPAYKYYRWKLYTLIAAPNNLR